MVGIHHLVLLAGAFVPSLAVPLNKGAARNAIPNKYIVTLKPGVSVSDVDVHLNWVRDVHRRGLSRRDDTTGVDKLYGFGDFNAYSGSFDDATIDEILNSDQVNYMAPFFTQNTNTSTLYATNTNTNNRSQQ